MEEKTYAARTEATTSPPGSGPGRRKAAGTRAASRLGAGEGAQLRAQMDVEVVPDQHDDPAGQLAVRGDQQVPVLDSR